MIKQKITANSFLEYYNLLVKLQDSNKPIRRGKTLTAKTYHKTIIKYMKECDSFTEFGVCQGPTLAAAMLINPKKIRAYDIDLKWYNYAKNLFEIYSNENNIDFEVFEADTSSCNIIDETDVLHIDSKHTYDHAFKELVRHAHQVRKYIIFHDTTYAPGIFVAINKYINEYDSTWNIIERYEYGVGYTVIKRNQ